MWQGNDVGTRTRSGVYVSTMHSARLRFGRATCSRNSYRRSDGTITMEILPAPEFDHAEDYHQQYLSRTLTATAVWAAPV